MRDAWSKWKSFAKKAASIQATILLGIIYLIVIIPVSLIRKLSSNSIKKSSKETTFWIDRPKINQDITWARKQ